MSELDEFVKEPETIETVDETAESQETVTPEADAEEVSSPDSEEKAEEVVEPASTEQPESKPESEMVPLAAKQAEKDRRKAAEERARLAELELARLQGMTQANQKPEEVPDAYAEPDKYFEYQQNKAQTEALSNRLSSSRLLASKEYSDYEEIEDYFVREAQKNPQLTQQMLYSPDPARFAYVYGKSMKAEADAKAALEQVGDLSAYEAKIREEERAKVLAEIKTPPNVPPDLTKARSAGGDTDDTIPDGNEGLEMLLGR